MRIFGRILLGLLLGVTIVNLTVARMPAEPPLPPGSKFVELSGKRIHYVERPGKGPAVVMIHGMPGTWGDWDAVAERLKGRHTIQIDRPGYAFSSEGYVPFDEQIALVNQLSHKLGLKQPVIAGHSYGGAMALMYSFKYPGQYSGIVAVDPAVSAADLSFKSKAQARYIGLMELPVLRQLGAITVGNIVRRVSMNIGGKEAFSPDPVDPGWSERALALNARYRDLDALGEEILAAPRVLRTLTDTMPRIHAPVRIIQGQGDELVKTGSVRVASKLMRNAHLSVLPGGHMQTYVHPDEVAKAIWLSSKR